MLLILIKHSHSAYNSNARNHTSTSTFASHEQHAPGNHNSSGARQRINRTQRSHSNVYSSAGEPNKQGAAQENSEFYANSNEAFRYDNQSFVPQESHYLSSSFIESQDIQYPPELTLDEEQQMAASTGEGNHSTYSLYDQDWPATNQLHNTQSQTHDLDETLSVTRSWSTQQLTEERLRLGLKRWESEEQQQAAYASVLRRS